MFKLSKMQILFLLGHLHFMAIGSAGAPGAGHDEKDVPGRTAQSGAGELPGLGGPGAAGARFGAGGEETEVKGRPGAAGASGPGVAGGGAMGGTAFTRCQETCGDNNAFAGHDRCGNTRSWALHFSQPRVACSHRFWDASWSPGGASAVADSSAESFLQFDPLNLLNRCRFSLLLHKLSFRSLLAMGRRQP